MVRVVLISVMLSLGLASEKPPPAFNHAGTARWMVETLSYGVLSTTSTRSTASTIGDPFGNPYSFADSNGIPYFYASDMDASMVDIFTASEPSTRVSLSMSEAELTGNSSVAACEIGTALGDPENPPCARLVLSGNFVRLAADSDENAVAKAALFARHPSFANFPSDHGFFCGKLEIDNIWLIDFYGSATIVSPEKYFKVSSKSARHVGMQPARAIDPRPNPLRKIKTARWMVKSLNWGILSTTSARSDGGSTVEVSKHLEADPDETKCALKCAAEAAGVGGACAATCLTSPNVNKCIGERCDAAQLAFELACTSKCGKTSEACTSPCGDPFGNPYAFADDSNGIPYFYASDLDASIIDLQVSSRMTLALSEATLGGTSSEVKACTIASSGFGDAENPPCARLVISGNFVRLDANSTESTSALAALTDRHPSFANFPSGHDFFVGKLEMDAIWFIDMYGGATDMNVNKYLSSNSEVLVV